MFITQTYFIILKFYSNLQLSILHYLKMLILIFNRRQQTKNKPNSLKYKNENFTLRFLSPRM